MIYFELYKTKRSNKFKQNLTFSFSFFTSIHAMLMSVASTAKRLKRPAPAGRFPPRRGQILRPPAAVSPRKRSQTYGNIPSQAGRRGPARSPGAAEGGKIPQGPHAAKEEKWIKRGIILVVLAAIVAFLFRSCMSSGTALLSGAYLPSTATMQDMVVAVSGNGAIEPLHSYRVTTLVRGEVLEAPFEEGQDGPQGRSALPHRRHRRGDLHPAGPAHPGDRPAEL